MIIIYIAKTGYILLLYHVEKILSIGTKKDITYYQLFEQNRKYDENS